MGEDKQLSSTWPKTAARRASSTLFHRTTGGSASIDAADLRGACDEEEGRGEGSDVIRDEDSPSPPRVSRRYFKRGAGVSAARRNGALCLALCVSAASLVWIISRDENGATFRGLDTGGPWPDDPLSAGTKRPSASVKVDSMWMPSDPEQEPQKKGDRSNTAIRRAAEAPARKPRQPEQPSSWHSDRVTRRNKQQQRHQKEDAAVAAAQAVAARDAADITLRTASSDGGFVPEAQGERSNTAKANPGPSDEGRTKTEEAGRGSAAGRDGFPPEGFGGNKRLAVDREAGFAPAAKQDVVGVGKWGAFEDVPTFPVDDKITSSALAPVIAGAAPAVEDPPPKDNTSGVRPAAEYKATSGALAPAVAGAAPAVEASPSKDDNISRVRPTAEDKAASSSLDPAVAGAAPAVEASPSKDDNISGARPTAEERPLNGEGDAGPPHVGKADAEHPTDSGGGAGEVFNKAKLFANSEGKPAATPTAGSGEIEEEDKEESKRPVQDVAPIQPQEPGEADTAGGGSDGAEALPKREVSRKRTPEVEEQREKEEGKRRDEEIRIENDSPAVKDEPEMKEAAGALPGAVEAAVAESRAAGSSKAKDFKKGEPITSDKANETEESENDESVGIREASKRAEKIRSSTRRRPPNNVEKALPEQVKPAVAAERADVRLPSRHADRWAQARKNGGDGDTPAIGRGKPAAGKSASTAALEAVARESASVARGAASAQAAAAEPVIVGAPPLVLGDGSLKDGRERGGGRREGEGGEALPCRLDGRVEDWKPPATADIRSSYRWADEQKASMDSIRRFRQGGTALRELIHAEVVRLDILRHDLFC